MEQDFLPQDDPREPAAESTPDGLPDPVPAE
jgi:hypothetical protein